MPNKYLIRNYQPNNFYHITNFGTRDIFQDSEDYQKFLFYLQAYLSPLTSPNFLTSSILPKRLLSKNLSSNLQLISYCLLPNHFHLLLKPLPAVAWAKAGLAIPKLLKQLTNAYTYYYQKKYGSVGPVFKGRYKSVKIAADLVKPLSRHLHLHPGISWLSDSPKKYQWSSFKEYLTNQDKICTQEPLLNQFDNLKELEKYSLDEKDYNKTLESIRNFLLDT